MHIYLMRHGHSIADIENKIESLYDSPLTEEGISQAKAAADYYRFKGIRFDEILSSPLLRAWETAAIIGKEQNIPLLRVDSLKEADRGILCGMDRKKADELYPRTAFRGFSDLYPDESGENTYALRSRAYAAINEIFLRKADCILVVSHGAILNEILLSLLAMPSLINDKHGYAFSLDDCEYIHFLHKSDSEKLIMIEKRMAKHD